MMPPPRLSRAACATPHSLLPARATITLRELNRETITDREGEFMLGDVPPGTYTIVATYLGYGDVTQTVNVSGDAARRIEFAMGDEVLKLGAFVVEGNREGQARALQQKTIGGQHHGYRVLRQHGKAAPTAMPPKRFGRLPGVFAEIDQNEGRYIVVRGIDANLNNITINGISVGSTEAGGRGAGMDSVPADLISRMRLLRPSRPTWITRPSARRSTSLRPARSIVRAVLPTARSPGLLQRPEQ
jgi:hypothetical protein